MSGWSCEVHQRMRKWCLRCQWNDKENVHNWVNEPMNQWIDEPKNQWNSESMNQWSNEAISQWINQPVNQSTDQSMNQWTSEWMNQWKNWRTNESMNWCFSESMKQQKYGSVKIESMNDFSEPVNERINLSVNQWIKEVVSRCINESAMVQRINESWSHAGVKINDWVQSLN